MNALPSLLHKACVALCVGLAALCALTRPLFTTLQELHELGHGGAVAAGAGDNAADSAAGSVEDVFRAPHCCVHAVVLLPTLLVASGAVTQPPPRFVAAMPRASPWVRVLRPPIAT